MFRRILFIILSFIIIQKTEAKDFVSYINYGIFNQVEGSPYIEVYFKIPYPSMKFIKAESDTNKWQATVGITITIETKEKIVFAKKYKLSSPLVDDTLEQMNLLDLRRAEIPNGDYTLDVSLTDLNDTSHHAELVKNLRVNFSTGMNDFSSVIMLDTFYATEIPSSFTNHDFELIPSVINILPDSKEELAFFTEFYPSENTSEDSVHLKYSIEDTSGKEFLSKYRTKVNSKSLFLFEALDISGLKPGLYVVQIEVFPEKRSFTAATEFLFVLTNANADKIPFQYWKTIKDEVSFSQLKEMALSLVVVSTTEQEKEWNDLIAANDTLEKPWLWLYDFCVNLKPFHPSIIWYQLLKDAQYVEKTFKMQKTPGCHTDRGRVYLKYGAPSTVYPYEDEPNAYPYEIWQYNVVGTQSNAKFIFYNPTRVSEYYILLHSDVNGELKNPQWKKFIYRRTNKNINLDDNNAPDNFGGGLDRK